MKKQKVRRLLSMFLTLAICFSLVALPASATEVDKTEVDDKYASLIFDAEKAYMGEYSYDGTIDGVEVKEDGLKVDAYRVTYVTNPLSNDITLPCRFTKGEYPAGEFFKMNILVPKSYDGKEFTAEELADAPIMIYTPWGGDSGAVVGDLTNVSVRGDRAILRMALSRGWIVIDPGMIGANQLTGTYGEDYHVYGKLPYPIVCMKAAIRYLRYDTNATTIPGDKERIFFLGNSSGGDMTTMIGASGNAEFFEPYLEELGAAPGRDDVFCALPSCPVMMRNTGDNAIAWQLYGDISEDETALEINKLLSGDYIEYLNALELKAEFAVPEAGIEIGDDLTADNFKDYILVYYKQSAIRYLNSLGGEQAINDYLASELGGGMYWRGLTMSRSILKPVIENGVVVDLDNTWEDIATYNVCGGEGTNPAVEVNWQYDHPMMCETILENGALAEADGSYKNGSSCSFGVASDYGAVYSATGQKWIQEQYGVTISEEYAELIEMQRNATDPMYFIWGEGATEEVTVAPYWHMRTGSIDFVVPAPNFIGLATKLQNLGCTVDAAFMWDEGHQLTSDAVSLFEFAEAALAEADAEEDKFIFDAEEAYMGEYTVEKNGVTYVFKTYQVTYCDAPFTDEWENAGDYFKMNIKVPVSINGVAFDEADLADAPILFYNPWGGDRGYPVGDPSQLVHRGNGVVEPAMQNGWIIVEPGMRGGYNIYSGEIGSEDYYNYGKLPGPLADLKAAIRYLRYDTNAETIPGDKERIWVAGSSSGGSATVMLGSSGNSPFFDEALEEIGALPGRDDVYGVMPSCPVMTRAWGDAALVWERWGDLSEVEGAHPINVAQASAFIEYQNGLGITAEFNVGDTIKKGDLLTADNYADYLMVYVKESAIKHLNSLGSKEAIEAYLAENKPANGMYFCPETSRAWIKPVYEGDVVVDIEGTWEEFWQYVVGDEMYDPANLVDLQYDRAMQAPDEAMEANGMVNEKAGDRSSPYFNASTSSFGMATDYGGVFSPASIDWVMNERGIAISDEYLDLLEMQANSVDPLYFVIGEGAAEADVCDYWYMRTGTIDLVVPHPIFINLATALMNNGKTVDVAYVWEQGHGITKDVAAFFEFANEVMAADEAVLSSQALSVNGKTVETEVYNIAGNNFFKLRDIAAVLSDTYARFEVSYDEAERNVTVTTGEAYTPVGGELAKGEDKSDTCVVSTQTITIDGVVVDVAVYNIGGNNFFKLRDLGDAIGFGVDYDAETRTIIIET